MEKGVDLSEMNGAVDFSALTAAGIEFVLLRCGYGGDYPGQQDKRFAENVAKAEAAGLPWGAYHYSYAENAAGGSREAAHALRLLGGKVPPLGLWLDLEDDGIRNGDLAGAAEAFCAAAEAAGLRAGVYASLSWWETLLTAPVFDRYGRWCAQWNSSCDLQKPWVLWQFTDRLSIGGKQFDGNYLRDPLPAAQPAPAAPPEEPSPWAAEAVAYCREHGLMVGDPDGGFRPFDPITRQEAAQLMMNLHRALRP